MNQQYIQNLSDEELKQRLLQFDPALKDYSEGLLEKLMPLVKTRMQTLKEFKQLTEHFISTPQVSDDEMNKIIAQYLFDNLSKLDHWSNDNILSSFREVLQKYKVRMPVLYTIFTGQPKGLPLPESLVILGKERTLERLSAYV